MSIIHHIRRYHATLAIFSILAYSTGEFGIVHAWLGFAVAAITALRLLWALSGNPHIGLMRFYPSFHGLNLSNAFTHPSISRIFMLGIGLSLIMVTATGIMMDQGQSIGLSDEVLSVAAKDKSFAKEALEETHEFFANLLLLFVGLHVSYLLLFKQPLAKFMLFIKKSG